VALQLSPRAQRLVAKPLLTVVGTKRPDGTLQLNPVWFEYRDGYFWLNSARGRAWPRNLERDSHVTLLILDKQDDHYWAQVQGRVVEATREGAVEHINRLAQRYTGKKYQLRPGMERIMFKVEPLRLSGEQIG
jgi:PPOX class probable F420-dependent enzyme